MPESSRRCGHWAWRRLILAISTDPEGVRRQGYWIGLWDFLFDAPTGATVICAFGALLAVLAVLRAVLARRSPA